MRVCREVWYKNGMTWRFCFHVHPRIGFTAALAILAALTASGCRGPQVEEFDQAYVAQHEAWRAQRLANLTSEDGWLAVAGLHWLEPGPNAFGNNPGNPVLLDVESVPPTAGVFELAGDGSVHLRGADPAAVRVNGEPAADRLLASDRDRAPDVIQVGRLRLTILERGDRRAVRVRDPLSPRRTGFPGIDTFPLSPRYRVEGEFEAYPEPRPVRVAASQGPPQEMTAPGVIRFEVDGVACSLEPFTTGPDDPTFFLVFADATTGSETYGGGRFLSAAAPAPGDTSVVLDFNRAINPPCALTPFATCPRPPEGNHLPVPVRAGEKLFTPATMP